MASAARLSFALCFLDSLPCSLAIQPSPIKFGFKESLSEVGIGDRRRRRTRRRRSRRRRGTIDVDFSGNRHRESPDPDQSTLLWRPELVKSERCSDTACQMCNHKTDDGCWVGMRNPGDMRLAVKPNSDFKRFTQEAFVQCPLNQEARMSVWARKIQNGKINVFVNNELVDVIAVGSTKRFEYTPETHNIRVRLEFVPNQHDRASGAQAEIKATGIAQSTDVCMSTKNCLSALGDGSDAGFELRNNNNMQRMCLQNGAMVPLPSRLHTTCAAWLQCLPEKEKFILKALLNAGGVPGQMLQQFPVQFVSVSASASFADVVATTRGNFTLAEDPSGCVNPAIADPESWDCECVDDMIKSCGGVEEDCFKKIMCDNVEVCQSWKDAVDCTSLMQTNKENDSANVRASVPNAALGQRSREQASTGIADALDGSLAGKCSQ